MKVTLSETMMQEGRQWFELTLTLPDGPERFQAALTQAAQAHITDVPSIARCLSLAHAAISVSGTEDRWASWYRDMSQRLMQRAIEAMSLLDAMPASSPSSAGLN
ncbi:hypothetical protein [Kaistia adipata]|uniref:hypothetical protein n=1 Tax=Kaistia adipata TaxID=166954 RepID=UPI000420BD52|nr:hypothetical protein [Kaistia adipata]